MDSAMLETKFYLPSCRPGAMPRPRLMHKLDRGASTRLTLISAPAGFGKTMVLAQWLERRTQVGPATVPGSLCRGR